MAAFDVNKFNQSRTLLTGWLKTTSSKPQTPVLTSPAAPQSAQGMGGVSAYPAAQTARTGAPAASSYGAGRNSALVPEKSLFEKYSTDVNKFNRNIGRVAGESALSGVAQFNKGLAQTADLFLPEELLGENNVVGKVFESYKSEGDKYAEQARKTWDKSGRTGKAVGTVIEGAAGALPNAILSLLTLGGSAAAQGTTAGLQAASTAATTSGLIPSLSMAAQTMLKNPLYWTSFARTVGNSYEEAKAEGASELSAISSAMVSGLLTAGVEVGGGTETLPGELAKNTSKSAVRKWVDSMLEEGLEEPIQSVIEQLSKKLFYDRDKPFVSIADENAVFNPVRAAKETSTGMAVGGLLSGGQVIGQNITQSKAPLQTVQNAPESKQVATLETTIKDGTSVPAAQEQGTAEVKTNIVGSLQVGDTVTLPTGIKGTVSERTTDTVSFSFSNGGKAYVKLDGSEGSLLLNMINSGAATVKTNAPANALEQDIENKAQPQTTPGVNSQSAQDSANNTLPEGTGAMSNPYPYQQKQSNVGRKTFSRMYWDVLNQIESEGANVTNLNYDVATEKQSMERAQQRLEFDLAGEMTDLPVKAAWSGEDLDTAMGIMDKLLYEAQETKDYAEVNRWAKLIQEKGTNAGQTVQAFAKYNRTPQGAIVDTVKALDETNLSAEKKAEILDIVSGTAQQISSTTDGDTAAMLDIIHGLAKVRNTVSWRTKDIGNITESILQELDFDTLKSIATAQLDSVASDYVKPSIGKQATSYLIKSHLSSVSTFLRNLTSNQIFDVVDSVANNVSVPIDLLLSQYTGKRTVGINKSWLSAEKRAGALNAAKRSLAEVMLDVDTTGAETRYGTTLRRTNKMIGGPLSRFMSRWEALLSVSLNVTDEFAKGSVRAETVESLQKFVNSGQLTQDEVSAIANNEALYRTFQDKTKVGGVLSAARDALNQWGVSDTGRTTAKGKPIKEFGVGTLVVTYPGVPGALVTRAAEYSPAGAVDGGVQLLTTLKAAKDGTLTVEQQRAAVKDLGRGLTGSAGIALFWALAKAGLMKRADDEDDPDVAALNAAEGLSGTQINIDASLRWLKGGSAEWHKGDALISVGFLQPINGQMTIGSLLANGEEMSPYAIAASTAGGLLESASDLSMIQNINTISRNLLYGTPEEIPASLLQNTASGFIPAPVRQTAKAADQYYRDAYGSVGDTLKNSVPGLRETLPSKLTPFGDEKTYEDSKGLNIANSLFLPGAVNTYRQSDVSKELQTVSEATGSAGFYPSSNPPVSISENNQSFELSEEEQRSFQELRGQTTYEVMQEITGGETYKKAGIDEKAQMLSDAVEYAYELTKSKFLEGRGVDYSTSSLENAIEAAQSGINMDVFFNYADKAGKLTADKDANGKTIADSKKKKVLALIDSMDITDEQKDMLYYQNNYAKSTIGDAPWKSGGSGQSNPWTTNPWAK